MLLKKGASVEVMNKSSRNPRQCALNGKVGILLFICNCKSCSDDFMVPSNIHKARISLRSYVLVVYAPVKHC